MQTDRVKAWGTDRGHSMVHSSIAGLWLLIWWRIDSAPVKQWEVGQIRHCLILHTTCYLLQSTCYLWEHFWLKVLCTSGYLDSMQQCSVRLEPAAAEHPNSRSNERRVQTHKKHLVKIYITCLEQNNTLASNKWADALAKVSSWFAPMAELSPQSRIFSAAAAISPNFCVKCIKHRQPSSTPTGKIGKLRKRPPRKKMDLVSGSLKMTQLLFCRNIKT